MTAAAGVRHSALYVGAVRHRRFDHPRHSFVASLYLCYLDLDELDAAFAGRFGLSTRRPAPLWFRRADYFGPPELPLADAVRDAVAATIGVRPDGAVRLLTNLRCWWLAFNPVSFYYCFDRDERLVAVLAQITNTPWGERHHHVVAAEPGRRRLAATFQKRFHVSPFQPMDQIYRWQLSPPGERLAVHMQNRSADRVVFDATLRLERRAWSGRNLFLTVLRHPFMTGKVLLSIYWQALRLWCKRATFHRHPAEAASR